MPRRVIIIGAGPIGLAAALGALERGFEVRLLEKGEVGQSLRRWGSTRFFTPLAMNVSPAMLELLGRNIPSPDALLTGPEMVAEVLEPLAKSAPLRERVLTRHSVKAIGRRGLTRGDYPAHPMRGEKPFRLLVDTPEGEIYIEAEIVLDATGGYTLPAAFGAGGVPARGESSLVRPVIRTLGELDARLPALRGKRLLLIGHGHSAANALLVLSEHAKTNAGTTVEWVVRTPKRRPCEEIANDPLPERQRVARLANDLAEEAPAFLTVHRRVMVDSVAESDGHFQAILSAGQIVTADEMAAFTGYRPDSSFLGELALETSPVTEGGARLYRAISNITDCLAVPKLTPTDFETGEPGFRFIGSRAYGRARTFLLQTGLAQLETILDHLDRG